MNYRAYGTIISSKIPLPELAAASEAHADLSFVLGAIPDSDAWIRREQRPDGDDRPWLILTVRETAYRLTFDGGADFTVSSDGSSVTADPRSAEAPETLRHLFLDQVLPLALSHTGRLVLHASAVVPRARTAANAAIALLGPAHAGKSTLCASFAGDGARLVADDALVVHRQDGCLMATPAYAGVRIWPDAVAAFSRSSRPRRVAPYTNKRRLGVADGLRFSDMPVPLARLYLLDAGDENRADIRIAPLSRRDAVMALIEHTYVLDTADRTRIVARFHSVSSERFPLDVRRLTYPRELSALPRVRAAIIEDLSAR